MHYEGTTTTDGWMDGWIVYGHDTFFSLGSCSLTKLAEGSKIEVHPTGWPQNGKVGV
jgi:hypothetical protein